MQKNDPLRRQAEARLLEIAAQSPQSLETLSPEATQKILHELRVHQIELEMQNEELRLSQDALDALRAHYFDLYDLAPVGYCTLNEPGMILQTNLTAATLLGMTRDVLTNTLLSRFVLNEDQDIYYQYRKQLFDSGQPQSCELRMVKHDGTPFWAHLQATAAQAADAATLESRVILTDISERKALENLQLFRHLLDYSRDGIAIVDAVTSRFLNVNGALCSYLGYTRDELLQRSVLDIQASMRDVAVWQAHQHELRSQGSTLLEAEVLHKDGSRSPAEISLSYVTLENQDYNVAVVRDITERKQAEAKIAEQLDVLRRWNAILMDREMRIREVKHEVNELLAQAGQPPRYPSAEPGA